MMLLKRLLLPGKGGMIICILILLNVLLWCGELDEKGAFNKLLDCTVLITSFFHCRTLLFCRTTSASPSCKYNLALVTFYYLVTLQFQRVDASEVVLDVSKDPSQQPVFNKTDPLSMTLAPHRGEGGATIKTTQQNDHNYNKERRRPVYTNNSSNSHSSASGSSGSVIIISGNSSNSLNNNNVLTNVRLSDSGGGIDLLNGSGSSNSGSNVHVLRNSSAANLRTLLPSNNENEYKVTDSSHLNLVTMRSSNSSYSADRIARLKRRKKGRTRNVPKDAPNKNNQSVSSSVVNKRKPKLLKELTMFNRQNCLAKLLCGVQVAQPPTKSSSALNDYAYLVKAFFDRFSIKGIVTDVIDTAFAYEQDGLDVLDDEADEEEEDDTSSERRKKNSRVKIGNKYIGGAAVHKARLPQYKYNPKYYEEYDRDAEDVDLEQLVDDDLPDFMELDVLRKRREMSFVQRFNETESFNGTFKSAIGKRRRRSLAPVNINRIRRKRGLVGDVKRGFMGFFNPRFDKTAYLNKRQLELESADSEARQLNIAEEIAARIRSPRQCRLLNWFGNNGNSNSNVGTTSNGMTTTITTITNTGGMIGNLDRLNGVQTGLPQSAVNSGSNSGGSQVVTVIQQSPHGGSSPQADAKASTSSSSMLQNMGQSASSAMDQASSVANHIGSTICPFNIQELQELILKAQNAPFPHFLTTTPAPPARIVPAPIYPSASPTSATATTTTTTTTVKASNPPQPSTNGKSPGQTRNGLEPSWLGDLSPEPHPTPPRYYHLPPDHPTPPQHSHLYHDVTPPSRPLYNHRNPTPPTRYHHHRQNPSPKPPLRYHHRHHTTPVYPSPMYPTPTYSSDYLDQADQQTRQPSIIPSIGVAGEGGDDEFFEDEPYVTYEKNKGLSPYERHKVHHTRTRKKPIPKWMTTTTISPDDEFYGYNDAIPNYSYGKEPQSGFKGGNQQQLSYKPPQKPKRQSGYKRDEQQDSAEFHSAPNLPKETTVAPTPNYIREFHQPPVVFDSKTRYPPIGLRQAPPTKPNGSGRIPSQNRPQQSKKSDEDEGSDEDDSESSDNSDDSEDVSDESNSDSSGEGESRAELPKSQKHVPTPASKPAPPTDSPHRGDGSGSVEASEEDDDESNEAEEKKERGAEADEEDEESDEEDDSPNDGKRSYERNDFSKDRGGPPVESTTTERPNRKTAVVGNGESSSSNGFFSSLFSSVSTFGSLFNRDNDKSKRATFKSSGSNLPIVRSKPTLPVVRPLQRPYSTKVPNKLVLDDEKSEELDDNDDDSELGDEENSEEEKETVKLKVQQKPTVVTHLKQKINIQMKKNSPVNPWVNTNTHIQVSLKTTPIPVVIEDSNSWSAKPHWAKEEDDSGEENLRENPVETFNVAVKKNDKKKQTLHNDKPTKKQNPENNEFTKYGISSDLNEFLADLQQAHRKKKPENEDEDDEEDESKESDEEGNNERPPRRFPAPFIPREPIDKK